MNVIKANIPNAVTCLNITAGAIAVIFALGGAGEQMCGLPCRVWAYIFICIAAVADFLDGFTARLLGAYSELGKQLDSLCDLVSFGVAPGMLLFATLGQCQPLEWLRWCALLVPVAGAVRLAKFNIDTRQTTSFLGLPIPANALFWIGYTALVQGSGVSWLAQWWIVIPLLLAECWMMVSEVPLFSLKFKTWGWTGNTRRWILIASAAVCVFCLGWAGLLWLILIYIGLSLSDRGRVIHNS